MTDQTSLRFESKHLQSASGQRYFCKYCPYPEQYPMSAAAFHLEFSHMRHLETLMGRQNYTRLFPLYYGTASNSRQVPYIMMEDIPGHSLEYFLRRRTPYGKPTPHLGKRQLFHLFDQLHTAIQWLYRGNMLQIDLSPQNILLVNNRFDIRLVDFTGCYYTDLSFAENTARGYGKIDYRIDPGLSPSLQLRDACALLFTRLFYSGSDHYGLQFLSDPKKPQAVRIRSYFDEEYPRLLDCIFAPVNPQIPSHQPPVLDYWERWHRILCETLS